jgi:hypothetical protein
VIAILFGSKPNNLNPRVARTAGAALLTLGMNCGTAARGRAGSRQTGVVNAITLYNVAAGALLCLAALRRPGAVGARIGGPLHLFLAAVWIAKRMRPGAS